MKNKKNENQILMYTTKDGQTKVRVSFDLKEATVWLSQKDMEELFDRD